MLDALSLKLVVYSPNDGMGTFVTEDQLDLFHFPARIIIAGFSGSGKTNLMCKIVNKYIRKFDRVIVCGVSKHPLQNDPTITPKLDVHNDIIDPFDEDENTSCNMQRLFILDDTFIEAVQSKIVVNAFTKGRHSNLSTILITQNVFFSGKYARNISLNATHYLLLRQRDMNQIECLGRQIFGKCRSKEFLEVYQTALKQRPFGYLLVDLSVKSSVVNQFRTNIVGEPPHEIVIRWKEKENGSY